MVRKCGSMMLLADIAPMPHAAKDQDKVVSARNTRTT